MYNIRKKTKAETLEGFKQELTGLRKIGEAYERAGNAYRKLQEVVKEDRLLTEVERREITTALLTYTYLNGLQTKANAQAQTPEILGLNLINAQRGKIQLDQDGKRINPLVPGENQVPMRDYYLSAEEGRDLDSEIMRLYNKPLQAVVKLNESTLEQIQEHVMATEQAQALSNISDPMAFAKLFGRQGEASQVSDLVSKVSASRKNEEINKYKQAQQLLQDMVNSTNVIEKNVGPEPDKQLEVPQAGPLGMK